MNQLLNNPVGKKKKQSVKKGCLFLIVGSLLVSVIGILFMVGVSRLTGVVIEARHGGEPAYALMTSLETCYIVAGSLFVGILGLWYFAPTEAEVQRQNQRLTPMLGQKEAHAMKASTKWLITGGMLFGVVLSGLVAVNSYRLVTRDGISTYFFTETKSYQWKQVSAYTIDCDSKDGLAVTFTMRDGKQYEILRGVNSTTEEFDEQYTSVTHFAADLDENMVALQVPRNVKHMERAVNFYRGYEGLWPYVSKLIGYAELVPEADETVAETEDATEDVTEPTTDMTAMTDTTATTDTNP